MAFCLAVFPMGIEVAPGTDRMAVDTCLAFLPVHPKLSPGFIYFLFNVAYFDGTSFQSSLG